MTARSPALLLLLAGLAACAPVTNVPSLSTRPGEAIDPRLPIADRSAELPSDPQLIAALTAAQQRAEAAARSAEPAISNAAAAVANAGGRESDSWIAAQQLLSAAIAARAPFTAALGDFDRLLAARVQNGGRLVPRDIAAAKAAAADLGAIDRRQGERLRGLQQQLR